MKLGVRDARGMRTPIRYRKLLWHQRQVKTMLHSSSSLSQEPRCEFNGKSLLSRPPRSCQLDDAALKATPVRGPHTLTE